MSIIENIRTENNGIVTAAIYICCNKAVDVEKVVSEQLDLIHKFVQAKDIIIVDSYIDRNGNEDYNRMLVDGQNHYFNVVLICGSSITVATSDIVIIDVLTEN